MQKHIVQRPENHKNATHRVIDLTRRALGPERLTQPTLLPLNRSTHQLNDSIQPINRSPHRFNTSTHQHTQHTKVHKQQSIETCASTRWIVSITRQKRSRKSRGERQLKCCQLNSQPQPASCQHLASTLPASSMPAPRRHPQSPMHLACKQDCNRYKRIHNA